MKGIIIYKTKYGSTEQYAKWLGEDLGFDVVPVNKVKRLADYDTVILGSCVRMGRAGIAGWVKRSWSKLADKKLAYYTCSGALPTDPMLQEYFAKAFPENVRSKLSYFPLNGRFIFGDLNWLDSKLMNMAINMTKKTNPEEASAMAEEYDRVNRDDIKPLVTYIKGA
jgi:menaquinone-dependent protoporphyrinogen oxidase